MKVEIRECGDVVITTREGKALAVRPGIGKRGEAVWHVCAGDVNKKGIQEVGVGVRGESGACAEIGKAKRLVLTVL